ncbi:hypothetical protein [Endozoicomonas lisbonensis]
MAKQQKKQSRLNSDDIADQVKAFLKAGGAVKVIGSD